MAQDSEVKKLAIKLVESLKQNDQLVKLGTGVEAEEITAGIVKLANSGIVQTAELAIAAAAGNPAAQVKFVLSAIELFQKRANIDNEAGVFGNMTRKLMKLFCDDNRDERTSQTALGPNSEASKQINNGLQVIFYHVSDELAQLTFKTEDGTRTRDAETMIAEAIRSGVEVLDITMKKVPCDNPKLEKEDANVLIYLDDIDGKGNILAYGDLGGPGCKLQLRLRFDRAEKWDKHSAESFQCTAAHELGHILGLSHDVNRSDVLMSAIKNMKTAPTLADIAVAQDKWGSPLV